MPFKAQINGVDVSANLKVVDFDPGGDGVVGTGHLFFDQQAGGMDLRNMMDVRVWQTFNAAGAGIAAKGRLFGGHVNLRDTGNVGTTKLWRLTCWDYNIILAKVVRDVTGAKIITLTAASFANQIQQLFNIVQYNGSGSPPPTLIDVSSGVVDFYALMPAVTYEGGHKLAYYIQQLCDTAQGFVPAIRPHFYMGVGATFGVGDVFGSPVLYIYDGALLPAFTVEFSDTPSGGQKFWFGDFRRVDDSTVLAQRLQSVWNQATVITSLDSASQSTYPCPYINHGGASNSGYWMDDATVDSSSGSIGQAQIALDRKLATKSNPKETFEFETEERVLPGDTVKITNALEGISGVTYRVAKVKMAIEPPEVIRSKLTINNRRLMLFDTGEEQVSGLPIEGDHVPPQPPGLPVKNSETFDWTTMQVSVNFTIPPSPSPDAWQYVAFLHDTVAGLDWSETVYDRTTYTPRREFMPSSACTIKVKCVDRNNNWSDFGPTYSWTTIAVPALLAAPGSFTNTYNFYNDIDDLSQLGFSWTAPADPLGLGIAGYKVIKTQNGVSTTILVGLALAVNLLFNPGQAYTITVNAIDGHGRDGLTASLSGTAAGRVWGSLPNPSFENQELGVSPSAPRGWVAANNNGTFTWDNSTASDGAYSTKFTFPSGLTSPTLISDFFRVDELQTYYTEADIKGSVIDLNGIGLSVTFYNASFAVVGSTYTGAFSNLTTGWVRTPAAGGIASPANARYARYTLSWSGAAVAGESKWVDNVSFYPEIRTPQLKDLLMTTAKYGDASITAAKLGVLDYIGFTSVAKTAAFTADNTAEVYYVSAPIAGYTITLPAAASNVGRVWTFKKTTAANKITIDANLSETIDGILTYPLSEYGQSVTLQSDGSNWHIIHQAGLILTSDGTRWLGPRLDLYIPFDTNSAGGVATPPAYTAQTLVSRFHPPSPELYWIDQVTFWVLVATTNNATNFWVLRLGSEGNTFGGSVILDQDTHLLTAGTAGFVTATSGFTGNPYDFSTTGMYDFFFEMRKTLTPGTLTLYGASMVLRKVYA